MARGTGPKQAETKEDQKPTTEADEATEEVETEAGAPEVEGTVEEADAEAPVDEATDEVEEEEKAPEPREPKTPATARGMVKQADPKIHQKKKKAMATIIIDEARTDTEQQDVFVTDPSDGTPFQIQRGKQVDVPIGVLNNLRESVQEKLVRNKTTGAEEWKKVPRFSFTVIKEYTK